MRRVRTGASTRYLRTMGNAGTRYQRGSRAQLPMRQTEIAEGKGRKGGELLTGIERACPASRCAGSGCARPRPDASQGRRIDLYQPQVGRRAAGLAPIPPCAGDTAARGGSATLSRNCRARLEVTLRQLSKKTPLTSATPQTSSCQNSTPAILRNTPGGLWGLRFGNGGSGGDPNTLYFNDGINGERDGLFAAIIVAAPEPSTLMLMAGALTLLGIRRVKRQPRV